MAAVLQILLISFSLSMDAVSVSIAGGLKHKTAKWMQAAKVATFFGVFQAVMPIIGWLIGVGMKSFIANIDHWIAFILLSVIGVKIIQESLSNESESRKNILDTKTLFLLAIATSIDALIVGITLNVFRIPFFLSIATIGIVTFILCLLGYLFGKHIGGYFGKKMEIFGGVVLILLGFRILIQHLFA